MRCSGCGAVWYWRRVLLQKHVRCPDCGTNRLSKLTKYDKIDRKSRSYLRRFLGMFGAPIYHCTFCRLQFRDYRGLDPKRRPKVQN
jgi:DNA-directed RNA polymerase subunit RPC12/RpoP